MLDKQNMPSVYLAEEPTNKNYDQSVFTLAKLLTYHERLRQITITDNRDLACPYTDTPYTAQEQTIGEAISSIVCSCRNYGRSLIIHDADQDGNVASLLLEDYLETSTSAPFTRREILHGAGFVPLAEIELDAFGKGYMVFILDHSFNAGLYKKLTKQFDHVIWIDHHPVAADKETPIRFHHDNLFICDAYSTAELTWRMVKVARTYQGLADTVSLAQGHAAYLTHYHDTWQYPKGDNSLFGDHIARDAKNLASWYSVEPDHRAILKEIFKDGRVMRLCEVGDAITKSRVLIQKNIVKDFVDFVTWTIAEETYRIGYAFHSDGRSMLSQALLEKHAEERGINTAIVFFYSVSDGGIRASVRGTAEGPPVNVLCETLGGGGHRNAAGFNINPVDLGKYLQDLTFTGAIADEWDK